MNKIINTTELISPSALGLFARINKGLGTNLQIVGGWVRDAILGVSPKDLDFVIPNGVRDIMEFESFLEGIPGVQILPKGGERFQISTFTFGGEEFDAAMPRTEAYTSGSRKPEVKIATLNEDSQRRDFTVNALYCDIEGVITDPTGRGIDDCHKGILHFAGNPDVTFVEDPIRILRAIRFEATKGFKIDDSTLNAMKAHAADFKVGGDYISWDRIGEELRKILTKAPNGFTEQAIRRLQEVGIMEEILPEFSSAWGFDQKNPHHEECLSDHLLSSLRKAEKVYDGDMRFIIRVAALLHDIAKPACQAQLEGEDFCRYMGHDRVSADAAEKICLRLKWTSEEAKMIAFIISRHMRLTDTIKGGHWTGSDAAMRRAVKDFTLNGDKADGQGEKVDLRKECLAIIAGDKLSHRNADDWAGAAKEFFDLSEALAAKDARRAAFKIDGNVIKTRFGLAGRQIGDAIRKLTALSEERDFGSFDDLLDYASANGVI